MNISEASVDDTSKFVCFNAERPKTCSRPPKNFHPLLQKEKDLTKLLNDVLPESISSKLHPKGSTLAHLYGLP